MSAMHRYRDSQLLVENRNKAVVDIKLHPRCATAFLTYSTSLT